MTEVRDIVEVGIPGPLPRIDVGEVATTDSWEDATVTASGSAREPRLNFVLPRGIPGPGAVTNDDASEALVRTPGTKTRVALDEQYNETNPVTSLALARAGKVYGSKW